MLLWNFFDKKKLSDKDKGEQRQALYGNLDCQLRCVPFELISPVAQILDPKNKEGRGYCHGYNDIWTRQLADVALTNAKTKDKIKGIELSDEIISLNGRHACDYFPKGKNHLNAVFFAKSTELLNYLSDNIKQAFLSSDNMIVIDMAAIPVFPVNNKMLSDYLQNNPSKLKHWHEIRLYIDEERKLHFFDANIGWFKSTKANPSHEDINAFLTIMFTILQYDDLYKVASVHCQKLQKFKKIDYEYEGEDDEAAERISFMFVGIK